MWTEEHSLALVDLLRRGWENDEINQFAYPDYVAVFERERLLKFPNSPQKMEAVWSIIQHKPGTSAFPGIGSEPDVMAWYLQSVLQNTPLMELASALEKDTAHELRSVQQIVLKNATGNGKDGLALMVETPPKSDSAKTAVYVILPTASGYRIEKVHDWENSGDIGGGVRYFELSDVGDTNGNRLPEFVVIEEGGFSGDPPFEYKVLEHHEWSNQAGKFVAKAFDVFRQDCGPNEMLPDLSSSWGPCEGKWEFTREGIKGLLRTQSFWSSLYGCPDAVLQSEWIWNGTEYAPREPVWLTPDSSFFPACRLAWAEDRTISDPRALSILQESLANWPPEADEFFGPAGRDFLQLRLGIWNDLQGNHTQARELLQDLIANPSDPQYRFAASLAQTYLNERAKTGKVGACAVTRAMLNGAYQSLSPDEEPSMGFYSEAPDTKGLWGFVYSDSGPAICRLYTQVLPNEIAQAGLSTPKALQTWLNQAGIKVHQIYPMEMNSDKKEDLLALMDTDSLDSYDLWSFLASDNGYRAVYIDSFWDDAGVKMEARPVKVGPNSIYILAQMGSELILFDASKGYDSSWHEEGFSSYKVQDGSFPAQVVVEWGDWDEPTVTTYIWDAAEKGFSPQQPDKFAPFETAQAEIERLLYIQQDYARAVAAIEQFVQHNPEEPMKKDYCYDGICEAWYLPYFRYLRALAYEQAGQPQEAIKAYYELWYDYSDNVFGMVAGLKIEQAGP
jgi:tetratricopeptide (TPR) repeat protein